MHIRENYLFLFFKFSQHFLEKKVRQHIWLYCSLKYINHQYINHKKILFSQQLSKRKMKASTYILPYMCDAARSQTPKIDFPPLKINLLPLSQLQCSLLRNWKLCNCVMRRDLITHWLFLLLVILICFYALELDNKLKFINQ